MSRIHTLTDVQPSKNAMEVDSRSEMPCFMQNSATPVMETGLVSFVPSANAIEENDFGSHLAKMAQDYSNVDMNTYADERDEAHERMKKEADDLLLISTSKKKMDRDIGRQLHIVDLEKRHLVSNIKHEQEALRSQIVELQNKIDLILRNADIKKACLRRKRLQLK